jgi:hypothetical protein
MGSLLAPDGYIWIAVPNADCVFCRDLRGRWHSADLPLHLMQFTPESLAYAARQAGLEVIAIDTYSLPSATAASIRQVLRQRYFVPQRLTMRMPVIASYFAPRVARRLDAKGRGEALMARFRQSPRASAGLKSGVE